MDVSCHFKILYNGGGGLDFQEEAVAVEVAENQEDDEEVAEGQPCGVEVAEARCEPVGQRGGDAAEVDDFAENVGRDGVHAVDFQPFESAVVAAHVNPPVEQCHQQEAPAAGVERHASGPEAFDYWLMESPEFSGNKEAEADCGENQRGAVAAVRAVADYASGKGAEHDGGSERQAAPEPCVGGVAAKSPEDNGVNHVGEVSLAGKVAREVHRQRVERQEGHCHYDLGAHPAVKDNQGADEVAGGDCLKGVGVEVDAVKVESEQVALNDHAEYEQQQEASGDFAVERGGGTCGGIFGKGEGHCRAGHEQEEGHDEVPATESLPYFMVELMQNGLEPLRMPDIADGNDYRLEKYEHEQVEASQNVERGESARSRRPGIGGHQWVK